MYYQRSGTVILENIYLDNPTKLTGTGPEILQFLLFDLGAVGCV